MLTLPIKRKWFDMILSGEKKEEYRNDTYYWRIRFWKAAESNPIFSCRTGRLGDGFYVLIRAGYSKDCHTARLCVHWKEDTGKPEWGAKPDTQYNVLEILHVADLTNRCYSDIDFDFWVQYERLLGCFLTYNEYKFIDESCEHDPMNLFPETDKEIIGRLKHNLKTYRRAI